MTVLLDTSPLLWTLADPDRLSAQAREAIAAGGATLSVVSYWEVVILVGERHGCAGSAAPLTEETSRPTPL